jgi:hypothetical protein
MVVVRQDGLLLIHQRPHPHTHRDLLPNPVPGHTADAAGGAISGAVVPAAPTPGALGPAAGLVSLMPPVLPAKEAAGDLAA